MPESPAQQQSVTRNEMRDLIIRNLQKQVLRDERFKAVMEPLGFFTVMNLVDGIADAVVASLSEAPHA